MLPSTSSPAEVPPISSFMHAFNQHYLLAFAPHGEVYHHLRTQTIADEASQMTAWMRHWEALQPRVADIVQREAGLADTIVVEPIPDDYQPRLSAIESDPLFQKTFANTPISFALVDADNMVAAQRTVNLDYVARLVQSLPATPTVDDLLNFCISPAREQSPTQHLEIAPSTHVFSSPNSDLRFLGAFAKELTPNDASYAQLGGVPAAAIIAFVGYGGAPINAFRVGSRVILNNGFHRVYALRSLGITRIPLVLQHVRNPQLEFPPNVAGLPREYLLGAPRPVLLKDFFEPDFAITVRAQERLKMVMIAVNTSQHDIPA
ncbi:MAG: hypothetical protein M1305_00475 [Candidatus Marsarchaeota archaeon]|nr:hypothetical protein [Candidatus Marsarchaeota archaeon]